MLIQASIVTNNKFKIQQNRHIQHHLKSSIKFFNKQALSNCKPYKNKQLSSSCKVLWSHIEELSNALNDIEQQLIEDEKKQITDQYWFYNEDDVENIFYDL
jgi:hypothetical protein